ncbi:MAG: hypothetical protein M3443_12590 [Actinomycetota bacterium]|nr:hypothetical protein [Actinomycetota bacterium]
MTLRVLFLGEGISDSGIVPQIEDIAARLVIDIYVTDPDLGRLRTPPGRAVVDKLRAVSGEGVVFDLIVVHRDADRDGRGARLDEISRAFEPVLPAARYVAVVPVRMTEAWLLTDEQELRHVAGNPKGKMPLNLPAVSKIESIPDPKQLLKDTLGVASGLSGRKLHKFHNRFSQHRKQLLERLDPAGNVTEVESWKCFVSDLEAGLMAAANRA